MRNGAEVERGRRYRGDDPKNRFAAAILKTASEPQAILMGIFKLTAIVALLGSILWRTAEFRSLVLILVSAEAIVVCIQAVVIRDYLAMSLSLMIVGAFNSVAPLSLPAEIGMVVSTFTAILFIASPEILKAQNRPLALSAHRRAGTARHEA